MEPHEGSRWDGIEERVVHANELLKLLEERPASEHLEAAQDVFQRFLAKASRPKGSSGKACTAVCGLVDLSAKSSSPGLREFAFLPDTALGLFTFYLEWGESDNHRSMKLALELLSVLLRQNPHVETTARIKRTILDSIISILCRKSSKPLVKSSVRLLSALLSKSAVSPEDVSATYAATAKLPENVTGLTIWRGLLGDLFNWMKLHHLSYAVGKLVVELHLALRRRPADDVMHLPLSVWHEWLLATVTVDEAVLEPIKMYVFGPLFTVDRPGSMEYLRQISEMKSVLDDATLGSGASGILELAALEVGKKSGIVEEPGMEANMSSKNSAVVLDEHVLEGLMSHPSHDLRSLSLSLVISSSSTTRPFSGVSLALLQRHLASGFADHEAKFRMEMLSILNSMYRRVRGAIFVLERSIRRAESLAAKARAKSSEQPNDGVANDGVILYKTNIISQPAAELRRSLAEHESFLKWYFRFLKEELVPTGSYPRHICALRVIVSIFKSEADGQRAWATAKEDTLFYASFDQGWIRVLLDLMLDAYDDVRDTSAIVLRKLFSDARFTSLFGQGVDYSLAVETLMVEFFGRADRIAERTGRADKADGVARSSELLYHFMPAQKRGSFLQSILTRLKHKLSMAEQDLGAAVIQAPVHGDFAALTHIWTAVVGSKASTEELASMTAIQQQMFECCQKIWSVVKFVLCDDSPEGHLPEELEETEGMDTKDLLSYCFRAVEEAAYLMRAIVTGVRHRTREGAVHPSTEIFTAVGNLAFEQLATLRHRGAFTTVTLTFATCCQLAKHLDISITEIGSETLLDRWYLGALDCIAGQVSTTRRSAGIPAIITGILSANADQPSFEEVVNTLAKIAAKPARVAETDGSSLPQVHALNSLKDIFKSSQLAHIGRSDKYIPQCLELATWCMRSEVWAIRNCGLLFLRSLTDALLGTHDSKFIVEAGWDGMTARISYHRYPTLPKTLLILLDGGLATMATSTTTVGAESVFPALDFIRRAGPPEELRDELYIRITKYLQSPAWHVREIAARTLCSCLLHEGWLRGVEDIIEGAQKEEMQKRANCVHGALRTLRFTVEKLAEVMPGLLARDMSGLTSLMERLANADTDADADADATALLGHPEILATYIETLNVAYAFELAANRSAAGHLTTATESALDVLQAKTPSSALLRLQVAMRAIYISLSRADMDGLRQTIVGFARTSTNTAMAVLEVLPQATRPQMSVQLATTLAELYIVVCFEMKAPEAKALALRNLADVMDFLLDGHSISSLPDRESLDRLWHMLESARMNPSLSNAIIRVSGAIMAALALQGVDSGIGAWGGMLAAAGLDHQDFDTRFAAAQSLKSFFAVMGSEANNAGASLQAVLALYDALNDDDDEVRDIGAVAARSIVGKNTVAIEAAAHLLDWLLGHFGGQEALRAVVAARMVGQRNDLELGLKWEPAALQLERAMEFDDSLFVIEEANLFVDEVRETERWKKLFESLTYSPEEGWFVTLREWTIGGLKALIESARKEDGPLAWSSDPKVYALCARILLAARALASSGHCPEADELLAQLVTMGTTSRLHELLVRLAQG